MIQETGPHRPSRILITGAAGHIGTFLRPRLARPGRTLRLLDVTTIADLDADEEFVQASIHDPDAMSRACQNVNAIVHLAGIPDETCWEQLTRTNIDGTRSVLDAARTVGITRVVLASSNHAAGFHHRTADHPLPADVRQRPDTYYGFTKAAMEALGSLYADRFGMDIACLRIGTCTTRPRDARSLAAWLSPDDAARLVEACLTAPPFGYITVWGISANTRRWWSLAEGTTLGYHPTDDAETFANALPPAPPNTQPDTRVGGQFCTKPLGAES